LCIRAIAVKWVALNALCYTNNARILLEVVVSVSYGGVPLHDRLINQPHHSESSDAMPKKPLWLTPCQQTIDSINNRVLNSATGF
jgi:hypothetical protein